MEERPAIHAAASAELAALVARGGPRRVEHVAAFHAQMRMDGMTPARAFSELLEASVIEGGICARRIELLLLAHAARDGAKPAVAAILSLKRRFGTLTPSDPPADSAPDLKNISRPAVAPSALVPPPASPARPIVPRTPPPSSGAGESALRPPTSPVRHMARPLCFAWRFVTAPVRHRRLTASFLALALAFHAWLVPEGWLGRGQFEPLPPESASVAVKALANSGFTVRLDRDGAPFLLSHRRLIDGLPGVHGQFGERLVALCARGSTEAEVIAVSFHPEASPPAILGEPVSLSVTPEAAETHLCTLGDTLAFATDLGDGILTITVENGDRTARRQFIVRRPVDLVRLSPASIESGLLEALVCAEGKTVRLLLNPRTGAVDSSGIPIEFIPPDEGGEPFLPRIVDRVRELPFVGNERIAALEDRYYGLKDLVMRRLYGAAEEPGDEAEPVAACEEAPCPEGEPEAAKRHSPPVEPPVAIGERETPAVMIVHDQISPSTAPPPSLLRGLALLTDRIAAPAGHVAKITHERISATRAVLFAGPTSGPPPVWEGPSVPPAIPPAVGKPVRKQEGIWTDEGLLQPSDGPALFTTTFRPDPARPFAVMHFASLDLARVDLHLTAGTEEPVSPKGVRSRGKVPDDPATCRALVALFNGGFRTKHGKWGFIADGLTFVKPLPGLATVAVERDGRVRMGTFGRSLDPAGAYLHLRQNLPPLVEHGKLNTRQKYWGAALDNSTHVWRSALGVTADGRRLIYGAGNALSHATLARGMIASGCIYAMQLDINDYHTYFHLLRPSEKRDGKVAVDARKLAEDMHSERRRGLVPYTRDFFYATWKASPTHLANE